MYSKQVPLNEITLGQSIADYNKPIENSDRIPILIDLSPPFQND